MVTLCIYSSWLLAKLIKYYASRTSVQGKSFTSDITGGKILLTTIGVVLLTVFTLGLGLPWAIVKLQKLYIETTGIDGTPDLNAIEGGSDRGASSLSDGIGDAADAIGSMLG
mgnify:CR=1 FL=1